MQKVDFNKDQKAILVSKVKRYFQDELDQDIGQFDAEFLIDFFNEELGGYFYNQGLADAKAIIESKLEDIDSALYEVEIPTGY